MSSFRYLLQLLCLSHLHAALASVFQFPSLPVSPTRVGPGSFAVSLHIRHPLISSAQPFDLLVVPSAEVQRIRQQRQPDPQSIRFLHPYSLLSCTRHTARHRDAHYFHYYHPAIKDHGHYAVVLRANNSTLISTRDVTFHFEDATQRSTQCPIVLREDPPITQRQFSNSSSAPRIVGGDFANPRLQSSLAVIQSPTGSHCSGSLISKTWVLTAAHCRISNRWEVVVGALQAFDIPTDRIRIKNVFNHEQWSPDARGNQFDIALIELSREAVSDEFMKINDNSSVPEQGSFSRTAGYGVIAYESSEPSETIFRVRQVDIPISPNFKCSDRYNDGGGPPAFDENMQVCAGYLENGGCDSCQGDSGGPLLQYDFDGNAVQIGIVSFGFQCGLPEFPGVYVRTEVFRSWMTNLGADFTTQSRTRAVFAEGSDLSEPTNTALIAGIAAGGVVGVIVVISLFVLVIRKVRSRNNTNDEDHGAESEPPSHSSLGPRPSHSEYAATPPPSTMSLHPAGSATGSPYYSPPPSGYVSPHTAPMTQAGGTQGYAVNMPVTGTVAYAADPSVYDASAYGQMPPQGTPVYAVDMAGNAAGYTAQAAIYAPSGSGYGGQTPYAVQNSAYSGQGAPTEYAQAGTQADAGLAGWKARNSNE